MKVDERRLPHSMEVKIDHSYLLLRLLREFPRVGVVSRPWESLSRVAEIREEDGVPTRAYNRVGERNYIAKRCKKKLGLKGNLSACSFP